VTAWTSLPATLSRALAGHLEGAARKELRLKAQRISQNFRAGAGSNRAIRDEGDALAYAMTRLPATYAAAAATLRRLAEEAPDFAPRSLLDAGCGLASATAAALETWPGIEDVALLDRSPPFLTLTQQLIQSSEHEALRRAKLFTRDLVADTADVEAADLILVSYAMTEIPDEAAPAVLERLWRGCAGALVIIEPGAPRDHARLMRLRERLISMGATIALPCPHAAPCPLTPPDWCHFAARLPRSRDHRALKDAEAPFEDEKFSYLVATRNLSPERGSRIIAPPRFYKWGARLRLCAAEGLRETNIAKRDKAEFRNLRSSDWGDRIARVEENQI
jgi:ribosomal protein RSM22 (predicted rRNA methylase)